MAKLDIEHDPVLRLHADLHKSGREPVDEHIELAIAEPLPEIIKSGISGIFLAYLFEAGECILFLVCFHCHAPLHSKVC